MSGLSELQLASKNRLEVSVSKLHALGLTLGQFSVGRMFRSRLEVNATEESLFLHRDTKRNGIESTETLSVDRVDDPYETASYHFQDSEGTDETHTGPNLLLFHRPDYFIHDLQAYVRRARLGLVNEASDRAITALNSNEMQSSVFMAVTVGALGGAVLDGGAGAIGGAIVMGSASVLAEKFISKRQ